MRSVTLTYNAMATAHTSDSLRHFTLPACLYMLQLVGMIAGLTRGVFTLDWCPVSDTVAVAGGDASIRVFDVVRSDLVRS